MRHRHLNYPEGAPPQELPAAALADILDRGDLSDWAPLASAVARDPNGVVAQRISTIIDAAPMYGTTPLWRAWIARCRGGEGAPGPPALTLAELRRRAGLTQVQVARRIGISQSDVSKVERRRDVRLSTLRDYLAAVDADLRVTAVTPDGDVSVRV